MPAVFAQNVERLHESGLWEKYFSPEADKVQAEIITDPIMLAYTNHFVTGVYKERGFINDQPVVVIPKDVDPADLFDPQKTKQITEEHIRAQHGEGGLRKYQRGYVFVAKDEDSDEPKYLLDVHMPLQRTYVTTANNEILYTVRVIQKNGFKLPIQSLVDAKKMVIKPEYQSLVGTLQTELSQLAGSFSLRQAKNLLHAFDLLFGVLFAEEQKRGNSLFAAVLDESVLNGKNNVNNRPGRPNYGLIALGEPTMYMGSPSVPTLLDRDHCIAMLATTHPDIAAILCSQLQAE